MPQELRALSKPEQLACDIVYACSLREGKGQERISKGAANEFDVPLPNDPMQFLAAIEDEVAEDGSGSACGAWHDGIIAPSAPAREIYDVPFFPSNMFATPSGLGAVQPTLNGACPARIMHKTNRELNQRKQERHHGR